MAYDDVVPSPESLVRSGGYPRFGPELSSYETEQERLRNYVAALMHGGVVRPTTSDEAGTMSPKPVTTPGLGPSYSPIPIPSDDRLQLSGPSYEVRNRPSGYYTSSDPKESFWDIMGSRGLKQAGQYGRMSPEEKVENAKRLASVTAPLTAFANPVLGAGMMGLSASAEGKSPSEIAAETAAGAAPFAALKAAARFPKTALGALGSYFSAYPDPVSADKGLAATRPAFTGEDAKRMQQLESEINNLQKQQQSKILELGPKKGANVIEGFRSQIGSKQDELNKMRSDMLERQSAYDKASQPISTRNPDAMFKARAGALGGSLASGLLAGAFSNPKLKWPWLLSAGLGGLEGAVGVSAPSLMDLGQPEGTPAREQAEKNLAYISNPTAPGAWDFARNVIAPEAVYGAGLGLIGHGVGHNIGGVGRALGRGIQSFRSEPTASTSSPLPALMPSVSKGGKVWPSDPGQINMYRDASGKWREQGTGHFIPKHLVQTPSDQQQIVRALLNKPK